MGTSQNWGGYLQLTNSHQGELESDPPSHSMLTSQQTSALHCHIAVFFRGGGGNFVTYKAEVWFNLICGNRVNYQQTILLLQC
jgi:hypothetical protein